MSATRLRPARLRRDATLAMVVAGTVAASAVAAWAEDARLPGLGAPMSDHMHGVVSLRDRTLLAAARAAGESPADAPPSGMSDTVRGAIGCTIGGTVATVAAFAAGTENTLNLVAGGLVPSVNRAALYVGLVGVIFGSFCAIGQALTPIITRELIEPAPPPTAVRPSVNARHASFEGTIPHRVAFQAGVLGGAVADATRRIGATALATLPPASPDAGAAPPVLVARQP